MSTLLHIGTNNLLPSQCWAIGHIFGLCNLELLYKVMCSHHGPWHVSYWCRYCNAITGVATLYIFVGLIIYAMVVGISHDIAFGMCQGGVNAYHVNMYVFWPHGMLFWPCGMHFLTPTYNLQFKIFKGQKWLKENQMTVSCIRSYWSMAPHTTQSCKKALYPLYNTLGKTMRPQCHYSKTMHMRAPEWEHMYTWARPEDYNCKTTRT